jgi:DNA modification methylase
VFEINNVYNVSAEIGCQGLEPESVDCCVTSPPYWQLRDYKCPDQIGLENTVDDYVYSLKKVFDRVYKAMKSSGTLWVNISDTYKDKSLQCVPFKFAIMMQQVFSWKLRQTIIWRKPNAMPSSVKDRFTPDFEYMFFFVKSDKYYFKPISEEAKSYFEKRPYALDRNRDKDYDSKENKSLKTGIKFGGGKYGGKKDFPTKSGKEYIFTGLRNKRSVWDINTEPSKLPHYAPYPTELVRGCLEAGCPPGGLVLDPFMGSGTTGKVAVRKQMNYIGFDASVESCEIAKDQIAGALLN